MSHDIQGKLDRLADLRAQIDVINLRFDQLRDDLIPEEIRAQIEDLEAERESAIEAAREGIQALEDDIRQSVLTAGHTVTGAFLRASYSTRTSWDTKGLNAYALARPEILKFRNQKNYISIRRID